jgi:short chain dehydrogenase
VNSTARSGGSARVRHRARVVRVDDAKIALVTGANKGIGYEMARQLAAAGVAVFAGARDQGRGAAAEKQLRADGQRADHSGQGHQRPRGADRPGRWHPVRFVPLDVDSDESVRAVADILASTHGRLDILVNNAATVGPDGYLPRLGRHRLQQPPRRAHPGIRRTGAGRAGAARPRRPDRHVRRRARHGAVVGGVGPAGPRVDAARPVHQRSARRRCSLGAAVGDHRAWLRQISPEVQSRRSRR